MSPKAAEAKLTRTISSGDLFAPKGGFSCPAFNSLSYSLDFDFHDPNPNVLMYDGLELSPLASSFQMPSLGAKAYSPLVRVNEVGSGTSRGWNAGGDSDRQWRQVVPHQQLQQQARQGPEDQKGAPETDYTTPTIEPPLTCNPNGLLKTASHMETPDIETAGVSRSKNTDQSAEGKIESEKSIWDRAFSASIRMLESTKRARSIALPQLSATMEAAQSEVKPQKKRRVVKKDPNKPKPKPWSQAELAQFRKLVKTEGANNWAAKAEKLGTNRSAKSLHTRWLREEGRIVDRPRGAGAMRQNEIEAAT